MRTLALAPPRTVPHPSPWETPVKDYTQNLEELRGKLHAMTRGEDPALRLAAEKSFAATAASIEAAQRFAGVRQPVLASFGSAYSAESSAAYKQAYQLNYAMAQHGYAGMTGGGPGVMEAANRGMSDGGGLSMAVNLVLPYEQKANPYVTEGYLVVSPEFGNRMDIMEAPAGKPVESVAIFEGGAGTGQEFWDVVGKVRADKLPRTPIVVMGKKYYAGTRRQLDKMVEQGALSEKTTEYIRYTNSVDKGAEFLLDAARELRAERAEWMATHRPELAMAGFGPAAGARAAQTLPRPRHTAHQAGAGRDATGTRREPSAPPERSHDKDPHQGF